MPPARQNKVRVGIDLPAILKMQEPLTVQVMRLRNGSKESIPLDVREGYAASGAGWTIEDVRQIDQELIDISGGGLYEVTVADATNESAAWSFVIPPEVHPVKPPRTAAPAYPQYGAAPAYPAGYPQPQVPPMAQPQGLPPFMPALNYPPPQATPRQGADPALAVATAAAQQQQQAQAEMHRRDLAAVEERHRHEREMAEMKRQIDASRTPAHDERFERERAAREAAEREAAEARRLAAETAARLDREAAERRQADALARIEAQIAEDRRRADDKFNALIAQMSQLAQRPAGPDPMMMLLIENQKATAEAAREAARIAAETEREKARVKAETDKEVARARAEEARINSESQNRLIERVHTMMAPNQMSPMDAARVVREASQSADQFTKTMVSSMNDMMDIQRNFMSNIMQMAPQGEGVAGRVVSAIENVAQTFTQSQAQVAAAQAHAAGAAQRAAMAPAPGWQPPPPVAPVGAAAPQPPADGGLNGATAAPAPAPAPEPQQAAPQAQQAAPQAPAGEPVLRNGKTDEEWFGPALPDIMRLREGVTKYLIAVTGDEAMLGQPKKHEPITVIGDDDKPVGVSPALCAQIIVMSADAIVKNNIPGVQAFEYFWKQQMYPALVDIMVPGAPPQYRVDVLRFLNRIFVGEPLYKDGDQPMFGIEQYLSDESAEDADDAEPSNSNGTTPFPTPPARETVRVPTGRPRAR